MDHFFQAQWEVEVYLVQYSFGDGIGLGFKSSMITTVNPWDQILSLPVK
jgi:hypothetical protein